jgi:hypothetical protein
MEVTTVSDPAALAVTRNASPVRMLRRTSLAKTERPSPAETTMVTAPEA